MIGGTTNMKLHRITKWVVLIAIIIVCLAVIQYWFIPATADPDAYYHLAMAKFLLHGQLPGTFPWLYFTTWHYVFSDQHLLYHILLIPFTSLMALSWFVITMATISIGMLAVLLKKLGVRAIPLWILIVLVTSPDFLFRISVAKANTLSLVLLFTAALLLIGKKSTWLLPLGFIFIWSYGGFILLPLVVLIYCINEYISHKRVSLKPMWYCLSGIGLGLLFHPHALNLLKLLQDQIFQVAFNFNRAVPVGNEWNPYTWKEFLENNAAIVLTWLIATYGLLGSWRRWSKDTIATFLGALSLIFLLVTLHSRRFIEYFVPFSLVFSAYVISSGINDATITEIKRSIKKHWQFQAAGMVIGFILIVSSYRTLTVLAGYHSGITPAGHFNKAAQWLNEHSQAGEIVFNTRWDQFPELFYYDQKNYYTVGMDPTFMYLHNQQLYKKWKQISDDNAKNFEGAAKLYHIVKDDFKAGYIFLENDRNPNLKHFLDQSEQHKNFILVYADQIISLYQLQ